jgi:hypothetical protein
VADDLQVGLGHPVEMPPESRLGWQERLVEQMSRRVFSRPEDAAVVFHDHAIENGCILFSGGPKRNQLFRILRFETAVIHAEDVVSISEVLLDV